VEASNPFIFSPNYFRNFDYESLVDAETENADRLKEENSPLLQQSTENENGGDYDNNEDKVDYVESNYEEPPLTTRRK